METKTKTITLETPIKRGEHEITSVELRKPKSGALRGLNLAELLNMDAGQLIKAVPRISTPTLTEQDMAQLDPADLVQFGMTVADFLLPKAARAEVSPDA